MAGAALFVAAETRCVLLVISLQIRLVDGDRFLDRLQIEHHVFDVQRLGRLKAGAIGLVIGFQVGVRQADLGDKICGREVGDLYLALLEKSAERHVGHAGWREHGGQYARLHLAHRQLASHPRLEALRGQPLA